jgi:LuxR family transcriptional regulator
MLVRSTYPVEWVKQYGEMNALLFDPTVAWGLAQEGAARWSEIDLPDPYGIFPKASSFGLVYGACMSIGANTSRTLGGLARSDRELTDAEIASALEITTIIHNQLELPQKLDEIHIETLEYYACGFSFDDIVRHLGISRTALTSRLRQARKRLDANSNVDAVRIASERGLLRRDLMTKIRSFPSDKS